jgi:DnaJ-class molecular chaperone
MRSTYDVPHENECRHCNGQGYTQSDAPVIIDDNGKPKTIVLGSGCPRCLGTGRIEK